MFDRYNHKDAIYNALIMMMVSGGGDGDVSLISPDYYNWANGFEEFIKRDDDNWGKNLIRTDRDNYVLFCNSEEAIHFIHPDVENDEIFRFASTDGRIVLIY